MTYTVHATQKLLTRVKARAEPVEPDTTTLGAWYANLVPWRRPLVILVNEQTLLPVLMPLAPSASVTERFPGALAEVLRAHRVQESFIEAELQQMSQAR